jgi:glycosyltransferase involved in cell wall biosynthesis
MRKCFCLVPTPKKIGGPASFLAKFSAGLQARGIQVNYDLNDRPYQAVLVIAGTRNLRGLWQARQAGIPIIQRLDGMNWVHRARWTGLRHYLRSEYGNWLLRFTRQNMAHHIIYQSDFSRRWWEGKYGPARKPFHIILNGVDLNTYSPEGPHERSEQGCKIVVIEGSLAEGHEAGLETAIGMAERLQQILQQPVSLSVAGRVLPAVQAYWSARARIPVHFLGMVPMNQIPFLNRSSHLLYASELNAACPNSVIESLACGLPVTAFDTGSLPELVQSQAGKLVHYTGNPWKLEPGDVEGLAQAAAEIFTHQQTYRPAARLRAEATFSLERMVQGYVDVLESCG